MVDADGKTVWWEYVETERFAMTVDGEHFEVARVNDRSFDYTWVSGPDPEYGFRATANHPDATWDHETAIRDFLGTVDPASGHLPD